jgi:hypothetical protein
MTKSKQSKSTKPKSSFNPKQKAQELVEGSSLSEVLGVNPAAREALRDRALELFAERKFDSCLVVLRGLAALGEVHPVDAMLLSRCLAAAKKTELAHAAHESAKRLLDGLGLMIPAEA